MLTRGRTHGMLVVTVLLSAAAPLWPSAGHAQSAALPSSPPTNYLLIDPCHDQLGALWAPRSASDPAGGNEPPMLGFYQGKLVAMVYYLSEKHLSPLLPGGGRWLYDWPVNADAASVTIAPAQFRPQRDRRAYEVTVLVRQDPPVAIACKSSGASAQPHGDESATKQKQGGKKKESSN
jgi:hypothetical protein